jgi:hypothetical protein
MRLAMDLAVSILVVTFFVGFFLGYGVRSAISQHHRAKAARRTI